MDLSNCRIVARCATVKLLAPGEKAPNYVTVRREWVFNQDGTRHNDFGYAGHKIVEALHSEGAGSIIVDNASGVPLLEVSDIQPGEAGDDLRSIEDETGIPATGAPGNQEPAEEPAEEEVIMDSTETGTPPAPPTPLKSVEQITSLVTGAKNKASIIELLKEHYPDINLREDDLRRLDLETQAIDILKQSLPPEEPPQEDAE